MTLLLKQLFNFLKLLNSDTGHNQIAAGITCGLIMGFAPMFSLQTLLVFVVMFFFRIQIGAAFIAAFFFAFPAYLIDPIAHRVGVMILEMPTLEPIFTQLYNMPIIPFTKFYNSIVMGSGVISIVLAPVVFIGSRTLILKYREKIVSQFQNTKFWKAVKATAFYKWYASYESMFGSN